jgi:serine/threonine protein kinase
MFYNKIVDPETNKKVSINSQLGKNIVNKYLGVLRGGAATSGTCLGKKRDEETHPLCEDLTCGELLPADRQEIVSGTYKKVFPSPCDDREYLRNFTHKAECEESVFILDSDAEGLFNKEIEISTNINKPKIFRYGKCLDKRSNKFKIEEKYDADLFDHKERSFFDRIDDNFPKHLKDLFLFIDIELHKKGLAHYDIKPENIMVKYTEYSRASGKKVIDELTLIDYGFINNAEGPVDEDARPWYGGTPGYLVDDKLSYKADIWAMGVTIYVYYLGGRQLFKTAPRSRKNASRDGEDPEKWIRRLWYSLDGTDFDEENKIHIEEQLKLLYTLYNGHLLNLLCDMLRKNPETRLGFDDLVHYPFFSESTEVHRESLFFSEDTDSVEEEPLTEGARWVDEEPLSTKGVTKYKKLYGIFPPR